MQASISLGGSISNGACEVGPTEARLSYGSAYMVSCAVTIAAPSPFAVTMQQSLITRATAR